MRLRFTKPTHPLSASQSSCTLRKTQNKVGLYQFFPFPKGMSNFDTKCRLLFHWLFLRVELTCKSKAGHIREAFHLNQVAAHQQLSVAGKVENIAVLRAPGRFSALFSALVRPITSRVLRVESSQCYQSMRAEATQILNPSRVSGAS